MKKLLQVLALLVLAVGVFNPLTALASEKRTVTVGVIGDSTNGIWELVQKNLDDVGVNIDIQLVSFTDGVRTNDANNAGELDLTAFQHYAFLNQEIAEKNYELTVIGETFISPMNIFSKNLSSIDELKVGDKVLIPDNPTNLGRALYVLDRAGLIKLKSDAGFTPTQEDIAENPLNLEIVEMNAELILTALPDAAIGIANSDFVLDNGMDPIDDALVAVPFDAEDEAFKPYINIIVARTENKNDPDFAAIVKAYQQDNVKAFILDTYNNAMVPVWKLEEKSWKKLRVLPLTI